MYLGSFLRGTVISFLFNTRNGTPATFGGTPLLRVLSQADGSEVVADIAPAVDVDSVTGLNRAAIDTDDPAFAGLSEFSVVVQAGTVDGNSVVGEEVRSFSLNEGTLPAGAVNADAVATDAVTKVQAGLATLAALTAAQAAIIAAVPPATANADALLARNRAGGSNAAPTVATCLASGLLDVTISGTTLTVRDGVGGTVFTRQVTRAEADAIAALVVPS